jgi:hypothetical protein
MRQPDPVTALRREGARTGVDAPFCAVAVFTCLDVISRTSEGGQRMGTKMQDAIFERSSRHQNLKISQAARRTISCIPFSELIRLSNGRNGFHGPTRRSADPSSRKGQHHLRRSWFRRRPSSRLTSRSTRSTTWKDRSHARDRNDPAFRKVCGWIFFTARNEALFAGRPRPTPENAASWILLWSPRKASIPSAPRFMRFFGSARRDSFFALAIPARN